MSKVALAFFSVAPIYALIGMGWGFYMGAVDDHVMMPAHAHLNLLGLVLNGIMGSFYGLAGDKAPRRLAWANFWLSNVGVVIMIPTLAIILAGNETLAPILTITVGEIAAIAGMVLFLCSILKVRKLSAA